MHNKNQIRPERPPFVSLHNHSHFSFLNGTLSPGELAKMARRDGLPAMALTDHGNLFGVPEFVRACWRNGIKPIVGCELRVIGDNGDHHLTLIARDLAGYRNLVALINAAHEKGFAYDPPVAESLLKDHSEGLTALSGCPKGAILVALSAGDENLAAEITERYRDWFGPDFFYLELQHNGRPQQPELNHATARLAERTGAPLVATANTHHADGKDTNGYRHAAEMISAMSHYPGAIDNAFRIADSCTLTFPLPRRTGVELASVHRENLHEWLRTSQWFHNFRGRRKVKEERYVQRLSSEVRLLDVNGWTLMPLTALRIVLEMGNDAPVEAGPEAVGSYVAYLLGFACIDPVAHAVEESPFNGLPDGFSGPSLTLRVPAGQAVRALESSAPQLAADQIYLAADVRRLPQSEGFSSVARSQGIEGERLTAACQAIGNFNRNVCIEEMTTAIASVAPDIDFAEVMASLALWAHAPAGPIVGQAFVVPPGGDGSLVPRTRLSDGHVVAQYSADGATTLGLGSVALVETAGMTFAGKVIHQIVREQIVPGWPRWQQIPMDDDDTWHQLRAGRLRQLLDPNDAVLSRLLRLLQPNDLNTLALLLAFIWERYEGLSELFIAGGYPEQPALGHKPFPGPFEMILEDATDRGGFLRFFRAGCEPLLDRLPAWAVDLARASFQDWDCFVANYWTLGNEYAFVVGDWREVFDHGPTPEMPFVPLSLNRRTALHLAATTYKQLYLHTHYRRGWERARSGAKGS